MLSNETVGDLSDRIINTFKVDEAGETLFMREYESGQITYTNSNEQLHRKNGAAFIWIRHGESWYLNGKQHRDDGPAFIVYGQPENDAYYLRGEKLTKEKFYKKLSNSRIQKLY